MFAAQRGSGRTGTAKMSTDSGYAILEGDEAANEGLKLSPSDLYWRMPADVELGRCLFGE